tara:strand:+ start:355 stop:612 length:258 start_codon:yes stop_codon:yes gene_type:complete
MTTFTKLETLVFDQAEHHCNCDYSSSTKQLAHDLDLPFNTIKGVVSSLIKKGKIQAEKDYRGGKVFFDLHTITENGNLQSWGDAA